MSWRGVVRGKRKARTKIMFIYKFVLTCPKAICVRRDVFGYPRMWTPESGIRPKNKLDNPLNDDRESYLRLRDVCVYVTYLIYYANGKKIFKKKKMTVKRILFIFFFLLLPLPPFPSPTGTRFGKSGRLPYYTPCTGIINLRVRYSENCFY